MLHDVICTKCSHQFLVTQARHAIGVDCPRCDAGLTVDFKKRPSPVEPGLPPYEVTVRPGKPLSSGNSGDPLPKKKRHEDDDDGDAPASGGSSVLVVFAAVGSMLLAASGLIVTGYFLYTNLDSSPEVVNKANSGAQVQKSGGTISQDNRSDSGKPAVPGAPSSPKNNTFDLNPVAGRIPEIHPPALPAEASTINLPSRVGAVAIGGGGRYLAMHFPDRGLFGVFDANTGLITATETFRGDVKVAAGLSRIVLFTPSNNTMHVYDIPDPANDGNKLRLMKLYDSPAPVGGLRSIGLGSRTNGPLVGVSVSGGVHLMAIQADGIVEAEEARKENLALFTGMIRVLPSGRGFVTFDGFDKNNKVRVATVENHQWKKKDIALSPFPGQDDRLYGPGRISDLNGNNQLDGADANNGDWLIPAVSGASGALVKVSVSPAAAGGKRTTTVTIHSRGDSHNRLTGSPVLTGLPEFEGMFNGDGNPAFDQALDQRFFLFPEANLLAIIPASKDKLVLRKAPMR